MAKRVIRTDDDEILRKRSREVTKFDNKLKELIEDMYETMDDANGVGLAAVQVGILKRVVTVDDRESNRFHMINPEILEVLNDKSEMQEMAEGCLSVPGKHGLIDRNTVLKIKYLDEDEKVHEFVAKDFLAQIMQHEIDHLNGILYIDKAKGIYEIKDED